VKTYTIRFAKIPVLSWIGIYNTFRGTVFNSAGRVVARVRKDGSQSTLTWTDGEQQNQAAIATEQNGVYEVTHGVERDPTKVTLHYNTIELKVPSLGEMDNTDFGCWQNAWGEIRINSFRTSIQIAVRDVIRTDELILVGYLSYFTMSRIGS